MTVLVIDLQHNVLVSDGQYNIAVRSILGSIRVHPIVRSGVDHGSGRIDRRDGRATGSVRGARFAEQRRPVDVYEIIRSQLRKWIPKPFNGQVLVENDD